MLVPAELLPLLLNTTTAIAAMTAAPATEATVATMIATEIVDEEEELLGEGDKMKGVTEGEIASEDAALNTDAWGTCGDEGGKGVLLPGVTI